MDADLKAILLGIHQLQSISGKRGDKRTVVHEFQLNPPLPEDRVKQFERVHQIDLPHDYRNFLIHLGNGGAGPGSGLERLGHTYDLEWSECPGLIGDLAQPFPYTEAWNAEAIDSTLPLDEQYRQQDEYWSSRHVTGAIPICHRGCNLRSCLIVAGRERGNMWLDDRGDWQGLYPEKKNGLDRLTFLEWYSTWLNECLRNAWEQLKSDEPS